MLNGTVNMNEPQNPQAGEGQATPRRTLVGKPTSGGRGDGAAPRGQGLLWGDGNTSNQTEVMAARCCEVTKYH